MAERPPAQPERFVEVPIPGWAMRALWVLRPVAGIAFLAWCSVEAYSAAGDDEWGSAAGYSGCALLFAALLVAGVARWWRDRRRTARG